MLKYSWIKTFCAMSGFALTSICAHATPYIEAGTSVGSMKNASGYFQQPAADQVHSGFVGSMSIYFPLNRARNFVQFQLGLQNRLTLASTDPQGDPLAMASVHLAGRVEVSRFFFGGGYSPLTFVSKQGGGLTSLHTYPGSSAYFLEGGAIWRVIPELQIAAAMGLEFGRPASGGTSPRSSTEFGLRFRFPLDPRESTAKNGVDFDGYRYPFGIMK